MNPNIIFYTNQEQYLAVRSTGDNPTRILILLCSPAARLPTRLLVQFLSTSERKTHSALIYTPPQEKVSIPVRQRSYYGSGSDERVEHGNDGAAESSKPVKTG